MYQVGRSPAAAVAAAAAAVAAYTPTSALFAAVQMPLQHALHAPQTRSGGFRV